ncbi:N/A [soil metagenome]
MTRMRRSLYSLAAMYLNTGIALVSGLIATPLLLGYLGEERLGLTRTATEWLSYTLLLGYGLDGTLNVRYSKAFSDGDRSTAVAALRAGIRAYLGVALISLVWVTILFVFTPSVFNLKPGDDAMTFELRVALAVAGGGIFCMVLGAFKPLAEAEQRGYICHLANALGTLVALSAMVFFAWCGFGLPGQMAGMTMSPIVSGLILTVDGIRRYPEILVRGGPRLSGIYSINASMLALQFCGRVSFLSDCILISLVLGNGPVPAFSITQRLLMLLQGVVNGIGNSTWAALADLHHRGEAEAFSRRLRQLTRITTLLASATFVPAAVWNGPFIRAWTGAPGLYAGEALSFLTAISFIFICITALWGWPIITIGFVRQTLPYFALGAAVNVITAVYVTHNYGVIGPPIGVLANLLLVTGWGHLRILRHKFRTPTKPLLLAAFAPIALAVPYGLLLRFASTLFDVDTFAETTVNQLSNALNLGPTQVYRVFRMSIVAALIGVAAIGYFGIAFATIVSASDRQEILARFRRKKAA